MRDKEKAFLKTNGHGARRKARTEFSTSQKTFDNRLRFLERKYKSNLALDIEKVSTDNPRKFWDELNKLGPKRKKDIPMECDIGGGNITCDKSEVLQKWEYDFSNLYKKVNTTSDDTFYAHAMQHKQLLEDNMLDPLFEPNGKLNGTISIEEVKKVAFNSKDGKSPGIDLLHYKVLKKNRVISVSHKLFKLCFETR
ncbi:unnamed protein product [Mytilus edulis]|uniref:Uncharacterized protein n=1 Tax=Mytilus edulis TaxID=6550 RepID=A0A8S3PSQ8_MYTED|nr:unnamed protein product [Mytilus edulis]